MPLTRRDFLKWSGLGLGLSVLEGPHVLSMDVNPATADGLAILYDPTKCVGCRACQAACKRWNNLPPEPDPQGLYEAPRSLSAKTWNLIKVTIRDPSDWHFFSYQCMHCADAACVTVCPSGALFKDAQGFTGFNRDRCIGCGYCTQFCPYGVPHLEVVNILTGEAKAAKCTFCQDRIWNGLGGPSCAEACPTGALTWGARADLVERGQARAAELRAQGRSNARLYGLTEAQGLHRLSILLDEPARYGLPEDPVLPLVAKVWRIGGRWLAGLAGAATLAGVLGSWLISRRAIKMEQVE
ncbi:MAG: 4Fe-4S dicluster domain-containing protein [Anaerolineae bacterium]